MSIIEAFTIFASASAAVAVGIVYLRRPVSVVQSAESCGQPGLHFLFSGLDLEHASRDAAAVLNRQAGSTDWDALRDELVSRFPGLPDEVALHGLDTLTLNSAAVDDTAVLHLSRENDMTRVVIEQDAVTEARAVHKIKSLEAELETLRLAARDAPYPIWLTDAQDTIQWHNTAYSALSAIARPDKCVKTVQLFEFSPENLKSKRTVRVPVKVEHSGTVEWYNVTAARSGSNLIYHAVDINAVIQAEIAQRNFVQTLAKTFAQLSIGLAIFDRNGQLALFNPALVDLTSLPAEFLSARPDLLSFFDRLRDNRVMPEPKNYSSWRQEIADVIAAATHGSYQETWTLDIGHTYRVSGRPHPDGAVAFLIEDITAEVSLTRNFRAELEMGQSLMDTFDDALVAFSSTGVLTFCNAAYRDMWKMDPDMSFADVTIVDAIKEWQAQSGSNPAWGDMRDFVMKVGERAAWDAAIEHDTHGDLKVQVSPIASGATVIRFSETHSMPAGKSLKAT
jgi:PAS domain-containing protein